MFNPQSHAVPPLPPAPSADAEPAPVIKGPLRLGLAVAILFFGCLFGWGAYAPLDKAAIASGALVVNANRKAVQHLDGGIVRRILVRDGDVVAEGAALVELDDTQPRAKVALLEAQIASETAQLALVLREEESLSFLYSKGLAQLPRLLQIQRRHAELDGSLSQVRTQLAAARQTLLRIVVRAPIAGTVVNLQAHTDGGVIAGGAVLMEIVPANEPLVAEVRIDPMDIDVVHPGLEAHVRLTPYNQRVVAPRRGQVIMVSADRLSDARSGLVYYSARIRLEGATDATLLARIYPGMPIEAMIVTGKRSALGYFFGTVLASFNRSFREE